LREKGQAGLEGGTCPGMKKRIGQMACEDEPMACKTALRRLLVEVSQRCNLRCRTCSGVCATGAVLELEAFTKMLDKVPDGTAMDLVRFVGAGEPLMAHDFDEMLLQASKRFPRAELDFFTNGMLLTDRLTRSIVANQIRTYITVSMDGATPETFEYIRRGASFHKVLENIDRINALKTAAGSVYPRIRVNYNMLKRNLDDIPKMVRLAAERNIEEIRFSQLVLNPSAELAVPDQHPFSGENFARTRDHLLEAKEKADEYDVLITATWPQVLGWTARYADTYAMAKALGLRLDYEPCPWALESLFIFLNGDVFPCCRYPESLGNIGQCENVNEIFEAEKGAVLRERLLAQEDHAPCLHCVWYKRFAFRYGGEDYWASEAMFHDAVAMK